MDQNQDNSSSNTPSVPPPPDSSPPQPIPIYAPQPPTLKRRRSRFLFAGIFRYLFGVIFLISIITNIYLFILLAAGLQEHEYRSGDKKQKIALIDLAGSMINMDTARQIRTKLRRAQKDPHVKAVILVVNSPGGQIAPSNLINRYIQDFRSQTGKKLYVSIQQIGASGAYWISAAAEKIYAQENALIGSLGVIYINLVFETALNEKLGISPVIIKSSRSPFKDRTSPFRMPSEADIVEIRKDIDVIHKRFVKTVSAGRNISEDQAWELANGDVFDGPEARQRKLIDKIGFLDDVIDDLAKDAQLTNPLVIRYVRPPTLREMLTAGKASLENPLDIQKQLEKWAATPRILALWLGQ